MPCRHLSLALFLAVSASTVGAQNKSADHNKEQERLAECGVVMNEVLDVPDNVPQEVLDKGRVRHRDSIDDEGRNRRRGQLRPGRDGVPHGPDVQR